MKLSARNAISGTVLDVKKGQTTAHVQLDIGGGQISAAGRNVDQRTNPPSRLCLLFADTTPTP